MEIRNSLLWKSNRLFRKYKINVSPFRIMNTYYYAAIHLKRQLLKRYFLRNESTALRSAA